MIRILTLIRAILFSLIFLPIWTILMSSLGVVWYWLTKDRHLANWCGLMWSKVNLFCLGVRMDVEGLEHLPKTGCMVLFNHTSFVDVFAVAALVPRVHFGAKVELFSIPFFGSAMRAAGILPITRKNLGNAIRVLSEAEERARKGEKFALAPEGKRNSEEKLLPFKSGPFIFAIQSGVPLVPVAIQGASQVWPVGALLPGLKQWRFRLKVTFLPPTPTQGVALDDKQILMRQVREQMLRFFPSA